MTIVNWDAWRRAVLNPAGWTMDRSAPGVYVHKTTKAEFHPFRWDHRLGGEAWRWFAARDRVPDPQVGHMDRVRLMLSDTEVDGETRR